LIICNSQKAVIIRLKRKLHAGMLMLPQNQCQSAGQGVQGVGRPVLLAKHASAASDPERAGNSAQAMAERLRVHWLANWRK
jgi:hypothetical protein